MFVFFRFQRLSIVLSLLVILAACSSNGEPTISLTTLPPGDATHGAVLFSQSVNGAPPCTTCHTTDESVLVGPGLKGFGARAGTGVSGESAQQYTLESITQPASYLVPGFSNVMYNQYATALTPQDIADLVAYLLSL